MPCLLIRPNLLGLYESFIKIRLLYDGFSVIMTGSVAKITDGVISEAKKKRSSMVDETDFRKAVELINSSTEVLLTSHTRPDGDACGSVRAMRDSLTHLAKKAHVMFLSPLASWYELGKL